MISIFNGRKRTLGGETPSVFAQVGVDFREHLHKFKGARLGVFLAIALHADENGWAWPSYGLLARETGYGRDTIARALSDLCEMTVNDRRVLLRFQPYDNEAKRWMSNRYLIFPSVEEIARYEGDQCRHFPYTGNQDTGNQEPGKQDTGNADTNQSHPEQEPNEQEPDRQEPTVAVAGSHSGVWCSIHNVEMERREKGGAVWYSHRDGDGWCKGAPGDVRPEPETREGRRTRYVTAGVMT
jgi:hypothetical protein